MNFIRRRHSRQISIGCSIDAGMQKYVTERPNASHERTSIKNGLTGYSKQLGLHASKNLHDRSATFFHRSCRMRGYVSSRSLLSKDKSRVRKTSLHPPLHSYSAKDPLSIVSFHHQHVPNVIPHIPLAALERLKTNHFCITCISLKSDGFFRFE